MTKLRISQALSKQLSSRSSTSTYFQQQNEIPQIVLHLFLHVKRDPIFLGNTQDKEIRAVEFSNHFRSGENFALQFLVLTLSALPAGSKCNENIHPINKVFFFKTWIDVYWNRKAWPRSRRKEVCGCRER